MRKSVLCICEQQRRRSACAFARCLDSIKPLVLILSEISRLHLDCVPEQAGLSLTWSQPPEDRFSHDVAQLMLIVPDELFLLKESLKTNKISVRPAKTLINLGIRPV